jgi:NAD(P)H-nitrite reductase large subunit
MKYGASNEKGTNKVQDRIICRCEEVLESEIRQAIRDGARTLTGIKLRTRAGMGLCQGKTCQKLVARILAEETGQSISDIMPITQRAPCRPVKANTLVTEPTDV